MRKWKEGSKHERNKKGIRKKEKIGKKKDENFW
jgi:hypothetical protein